MFKTFLLPIVTLTDPMEASFLEFLIEPSCQKIDGLEEIANGSMRIAVAQARKALTTLPPSSNPSNIRLVSCDNDLSISVGATLGITLSQYFLETNCPYRQLIATGGLEFSSDNINVTDSGALIEKIEAVCRLGYQIQPTVFILPIIEKNEKIRSIFKLLAEQNIAVRPVKTLLDAYKTLSGTSF